MEHWHKVLPEGFLEVRPRQWHLAEVEVRLSPTDPGLHVPRPGRDGRGVTRHSAAEFALLAALREKHRRQLQPAQAATAYPPLSIFGHADPQGLLLGEGANVGAGTITCNYDGFAKHVTTIGRGVFIGSDTTLVAPLRIGDGAYIAAGSTITENVPPDGLGVARGRQVNKPRWASRKRRELAAAEHSSKSLRSRKKSKGPKRKSRHR